MYIKYGENQFIVFNTIELELKLNITEYGKKWKDIGDRLFNYCYNKEKKEEILEVSEDQYNFLKKINSVSYVDVLNLYN